MNPTWTVVALLLFGGLLVKPEVAEANPWRAQADQSGNPLGGYHGDAQPRAQAVPERGGFGKEGVEARFPPMDMEDTLSAPKVRKDPEYAPAESGYPMVPRDAGGSGNSEEVPAIPAAPVRQSIAPGVQGGGGAAAGQAGTQGGVPSLGYPMPTWGVVAPGYPYSGYGYPAYGAPWGYGNTAPGAGYDPVYWNALNPGAANLAGWGRPGLGVPGFLGGTPWIGTPATGWLW